MLDLKAAKALLDELQPDNKFKRPLNVAKPQHNAAVTIEVRPSYRNIQTFVKQTKFAVLN